MGKGILFYPLSLHHYETIPPTWLSLKLLVIGVPSLENFSLRVASTLLLVFALITRFKLLTLL